MILLLFFSIIIIIMHIIQFIIFSSFPLFQYASALVDYKWLATENVNMSSVAGGGGSAPKHERRSATLSKQPLETRHCAAPVWSRAGSPASARSKLERWRRCAMMAVARSSAATGGKDTGGGASNGATAAGGTNVATEGATTIGGAPGGQALEPPSRSASCLRLS